MPARGADRLRLLGEVLWLLMNSRVHSPYTIEEVKLAVLIPIEKGQAVLFRDGDRPVGFVSWAWLSDEVAERYARTTKPIGPAEWDSGKNLWFMDFIVPFGQAREIVRHLREVRFPDHVAKSLRFDPPRRFRGVRHWRGVNVPWGRDHV